MAYLDGSRDLRAYLASKLAAARAELASLDPDFLLTENADVLVTALLQRHLPQSLSVDWDGVRSSPITETTTRVRDQFFEDRVFDAHASRVVLTFPVEGDAEMLNYQASTYTLS